MENNLAALNQALKEEAKARDELNEKWKLYRATEGSFLWLKIRGYLKAYYHSNMAVMDVAFAAIAFFMLLFSAGFAWHVFLDREDLVPFVIFTAPLVYAFRGVVRIFWLVWELKRIQARQVKMIQRAQSEFQSRKFDRFFTGLNVASLLNKEANITDFTGTSFTAHKNKFSSTAANLASEPRQGQPTMLN